MILKRPFAVYDLVVDVIVRIGNERGISPGHMIYIIYAFVPLCQAKHLTDPRGLCVQGLCVQRSRRE